MGLGWSNYQLKAEAIAAAPLFSIALQKDRNGK